MSPLPVFMTANLLLQPSSGGLRNLTWFLRSGKPVLKTWTDPVHLEPASSMERGLGFWVIQTGKNWQPIGFCGLKHSGADPELVYCIGLELPNPVLAEACRELVNWLWKATEFARVFATAEAGDSPSINVMRRIGMNEVRSNPATNTYVLERRRTPLTRQLLRASLLRDWPGADRAGRDKPGSERQGP